MKMAEVPVPGIAAQNAPAPAAGPDLQGQWAQFFRNPAVISGLLQFGSSMLTPGSGGIGPAMSAGASAATRALQFEQEREATKARGELDQQRLEVARQGAQVAGQREQRAVATEERKGSLEERKLAQGADQFDRSLAMRGQELAKRGTGGRAGAKPFDPTSTVYKANLERWQKINTGESFEDFSDEELAAIRADPKGWIESETAKIVGGMTAGRAAPAAPATEAVPVGPGPAVEPGSGLPPVSTITDEQWRAIASDPTLRQQVLAGYPQSQAFIQRKLTEMELTGGGVNTNPFNVVVP